MANECDNKISIGGPIESIMSFTLLLEFVTSDDGYLDLEHLVKDMAPSTNLSGSAGTKWFMIDELEYGSNSIVIEGTSAWGHALPLFLHLSKSFSELYFRYEYSVASDCGGTFEFKDGDLLSSIDLDYWSYIFETKNRNIALDMASHRVVEIFDDGLDELDCISELHIILKNFERSEYKDIIYDHIIKPRLPQ